MDDAGRGGRPRAHRTHIVAARIGEAALWVAREREAAQEALDSLKSARHTTAARVSHAQGRGSRATQQLRSGGGTGNRPAVSEETRATYVSSKMSPSLTPSGCPIASTPPMCTLKRSGVVYRQPILGCTGRSPAGCKSVARARGASGVFVVSHAAHLVGRHKGELCGFDERAVHIPEDTALPRGRTHRGDGEARGGVQQQRGAQHGDACADHPVHRMWCAPPRAKITCPCLTLGPDIQISSEKCKSSNTLCRATGFAGAGETKLS
eukprot:197851-Prymnesium_polylepis.2